MLFSFKLHYDDEMVYAVGAGGGRVREKSEASN